jgi:arylsulfatase A-like enzyme
MCIRSIRRGNHNLYPEPVPDPFIDKRFRLWNNFPTCSIPAEHEISTAPASMTAATARWKTLDWNVGRNPDALRKHNILDRTLIILTTGHGLTWIDRRTMNGMREASW